eukprot:1842502-Rhodomonas_salina.2
MSTHPARASPRTIPQDPTDRARRLRYGGASGVARVERGMRDASAGGELPGPPPSWQVPCP